jgi:3-hydroxyisobutyrate dehydrogenase-like beta-hydroxyacid dehydrogenase
MRQERIVELSIGFIGLGEAGSAIARGLVDAGAGTVRAYDIAVESPARRRELESRAESAGVVLCPGLAALAGQSRILMCTVVGSVAVDVAESVCPFLTPDHVYLDLNSVSPEKKRRIAAVIGAAGGRFIEAAVMTNVPKFGHRVPMLLCGDAAPELIGKLAPLGMVLEDFGAEIGRASAAKMFRSLVVKGMEALLLEATMAAARYDVAKEVLDYVTMGYAGLDWNALADNLLTRTALHGTRRAHELLEVAETLEDMGIEPLMASAGAERIRRAADAGLEARFRERPPENYLQVVKAIDAAGTANR